MPRIWLRESIRRVEENYAKPWDKACRRKSRRKLCQAIGQEKSKGKVEENYAEKVEDARQSEK